MASGTMQTSDGEPSDQELHSRVQEGDRRAFERLFRRYYDELCAYVESQIGTPEAAEDLVQNVLLSLWRRREQLALQKTIKAYLYGAARNESIKFRKHRKVRDRWQGEKRRGRNGGRADASSPLEDVERKQLKRAMQKSVDALPERRREVYVLSRQHGLTYNEIASVMDISPKTVDNQMVEALKFLRKRLRQFSSAPPA
jgi:RNA polymerase sigma-70 factor (ECF subfamily)